MEKITPVSKNKKDLILYLSYMNVISAVAVVILHANGAFWSYRNDFSWAVNNVIECLFYFAVPCFFMIIGAVQTDYQKKYSTKVYLKKRFHKTLIPFLFWSIAYYVLSCLFTFVTEHKNELSLDFETWFNGIFNTQFLSIYWFFIALFCVYLSMPLFAAISEEKRLKVFKYIFIAALIINVLIPLSLKCINRAFDIHLVWKFKIDVVGNYLIYVVLGYIINKTTFTKKQKLLIYALAIIGLLVHIIGTYLLSETKGELDTFFKGYCNLPCMMYSTGIFVAFKSFASKIKSEKANNAIISFSKYTFGIYLLHVFVMDVLRNVITHFVSIPETSQLYVWMMVALTLPVCILVIYVIRKIPIIKYLVP